MPSLSVCMMVQNVEQLLPIALDSLQQVYDELIIVDGGSIDRTGEIANQFGAKVIHSPWQGNHSQQRNVYLQEVKTEWVFVLDSDEFIDSYLLAFLHRIKSESVDVETDNFWFVRKWISAGDMHKYLKNSPHYPDWQRRLFKHNQSVYYTGLIHESIHGLKHQGQCVSNCSIYHLDLFAKTDLERKEKIRKYMNVDPTNGAIHFYLPNPKNLILEAWNIEDISPSTQKLLALVDTKFASQSEQIIPQEMKNEDISPLTQTWLAPVDTKFISQLDRIIPPEIKNDDFYQAIEQLSREENLKTILEIGSSSGGGSTEAFVKGILQNPNKPLLFCMEISKTRFALLQEAYQKYDFVKCYNVSSVPLSDFPKKQQVVDFYRNYRTNLNSYSIETILNWLQQDIDYINSYEVSQNGIEEIKNGNQIEFFDLVLIDGSEFTGEAELKKVYGARYILLDDINTYKNYFNHVSLNNDPNYQLIRSNVTTRNGFSIFKLVNDSFGEADTNYCNERPVLAKCYTEIKHHVEAVEGFMVPGQEEFLFNKVKSLPDDAVIVEIGSFKGRSTVAMGYACLGTNRKIYCIDTWDGNDSDFPDRNFFDIWHENVLSNGLEAYVVPLQGYSHEVLTIHRELFAASKIDFIFIDGSHQFLDVLKDFELSFPLVKKGGWIAFHDVIHTWIGCEQVWHHVAKNFLDNHQYSSTLACGQKTRDISLALDELPVHFFTIVLNGEPFIKYHIDVLKQLPFKWHWHIVEGVADLKHDTGWSLKLGGLINDEIHQNGRSNDGTTSYLDELARIHPNQVTVYRKPEGTFWNGKREMVNEPILNISEDCLLFQIDVDELWSVEQLCTARYAFINHPEKTAAFYWCWYFVGQDLIISTRNCYAQNPQQEWLRTWRYKPGMVWAAHEPPILVEPLPNGEWRNVATINCFSHEETEELGLVFQHFAYVMPKQLQFKEQYYGYKDALNCWNRLQEQNRFPALLREFLPWVRDNTLVDTTESLGIPPIARQKKDGNWHFVKVDIPVKIKPKQEQREPKILVDGVFFQLYNTGIARVWRSLLAEWVKTGFANHVVVLDRNNTAPKIDGVWYRTIPAYSYDDTEGDRQMLQQICDEEGASLFVSTYYTTPLTTPSVFMAYDMIPEVMQWDLNNPMWREKHYAIQHASSYISISENTATDIVKFFPDIVPESVQVAYCGVQDYFTPATNAEIESFKNKYGIRHPYFMLVGIGGYKNPELFLKAFKQLPTRSAFDILLTGASSFTDELRNYTAGSTVHFLQLSDAELRLAYSGAIALVYPSKYEGFGLPVLEALACGCPVITCPNASIPEVAGEAALYVDDEDVDAMADALCEVQKPTLRELLISAGLEQAQKFSWSSMADKVSSALIDATLLSLNLKENNLVIFPDWTQPEEELGMQLIEAIHYVASNADKEQTTLLVDISNTSEDEANLMLSSVAMNLMMEAELDVADGPEISLVSHLSSIQWQALLPKIQGRIALENDNEEAIARAQAQDLPVVQLAAE